MRTNNAVTAFLTAEFSNKIKEEKYREHMDILRMIRMVPAVREHLDENWKAEQDC
jgi:uncharacterized protein (DUF2236 family)